MQSWLCTSCLYQFERLPAGKGYASQAHCSLVSLYKQRDCLDPILVRFPPEEVPLGLLEVEAMKPSKVWVTKGRESETTKALGVPEVWRWLVGFEQKLEQMNVSASVEI